MYYTEFMKAELPIACKLTEPAFQERRSKVLRQVGQSIIEVKELEDGVAYCFPSDDDWLTNLTEFIRFERECCPFLSFRLSVASDDGPLWLELRGPAGTKEFLATLFS
jgi:hypothetical protein